jgi:hypothetical protein
MTIRELIEEGFRFATTYRSLWVFGFFVGLASGGSNGGGRPGGDGGAGSATALGGALGLFATEIAIALAAVVLVVVVASFVLRFVSEGALIDGVIRTRRGEAVTTRAGFRAGWAHCGVLVQIGLLYFAALVGSVAVLAAPVLLALWRFGAVGGLLVGLLALVVGIPWLITLSLVQAFALRIAVAENRRALDAIRKARLFLHGRLIHGLKLMVADFLGSLAMVALFLVVLIPVLLMLAASAVIVPIVPLIVVGGLIVVPLSCVLTAILGTFRSSVWTIGYLSQVEP